MPSPTRILFVASEASPFTDASDLGTLIRRLPEKLQESGLYELRIMMPRYGVISERRNRLHEVIRLSGAEIAAGEQLEVLKVKVASIPGLRLQIYFMENARYFKRKGTWEGRDGERYDDNAERALFFSRAALITIRNLGWSPDLVHALGWASAFVPHLVATEFANDELLGKAKLLYTPDGHDAETPVGEALGGAERTETLRSLAQRHADGLLFLPDSPETPRLPSDPETVVGAAVARYEEVLGQVPA